VADCFGRGYKEAGFTQLFSVKYCFNSNGSLSYKSGGLSATVSGGSELYSSFQGPHSGYGYYAFSPTSLSDDHEELYVFYVIGGGVGLISWGRLDNDPAQFVSAVDGLLEKQ
jgi:hypothetical protein